MCGVYRYGEKYGGREGVCVCGVCIGMVKSIGAGGCVCGVYRYGEKYRGGRVCVSSVCIGMVKSIGAGGCVWCV